MNQILKPKQAVRMESSGTSCEVEEYLGGGGQGEVYRATLAGKPVAVKWYYPQIAKRDQWFALEILVGKGPPSEHFLWPMDIASAANVPGFGYVMPLRAPHFKGIHDLMKRRIEPTFRSLATAGRQLSHSFLQLHSMGLCYCDISFGNVFFDPKTGSVLICDNDNVVVDRQARSDGVAGTPRFMAPEIVRGESLPSSETDLFSLSVLLFYMFMVHHPLEGLREASIHAFDLPAMTKIYGKEPIFIFDPDNDSNRPVPGYHDNPLVFWPLYPEFFRKLFIQAFTVGLREPSKRVRESEWRVAMERLADVIVYCSCGAQNFFDSDRQSTSCWACKKAITLPMRLQIGKHFIMLNHDTQLFPHHIDENRTHDFSEPWAAIQQNPADARIWGLKNLTKEKWVCSLPDGSVKDVEHGRAITLALGTTIHFGNTKTEIM
jgi:eukaryotic-like serine/threonine-protein kinase